MTYGLSLLGKLSMPICPFYSLPNLCNSWASFKMSILCPIFIHFYWNIQLESNFKFSVKIQILMK